MFTVPPVELYNNIVLVDELYVPALIYKPVTLFIVIVLPVEFKSNSSVVGSNVPPVMLVPPPPPEPKPLLMLKFP